MGRASVTNVPGHESAIDWSEDTVLAEARAAAGLSDFGGDAFRPGLRALLRTYAEQPFTAKGNKRNRRRMAGRSALTA